MLQKQQKSDTNELPVMRAKTQTLLKETFPTALNYKTGTKESLRTEDEALFLYLYSSSCWKCAQE